MKFFLTLKHWQFFVFACVLPFFIDLTSFINYTIGAIYVFPLMMILFVFFFFGWFYAVGTNLYPKLPAKAKMSLTRFKIFLFFPVFYILAISVFLVVSMPYSTSGGPIEPWIFLLILPLHLFSMFCIFYCLYFIAKALKSVETQVSATFSDYLGDFFLIWFFPIGIWFIQPRINKLFNESDAGEEVVEEVY